MTLLRSLLLATALALPITATHAVMTDITAEAAGKKKAKKSKKAKKVAYKHCGTYKYWKKGKCLDARAKK